MKYPQELQTLVSFLKKLPGVGKKTAERFAFDFLSWQQDELNQFGEILPRLLSAVAPCSICGCLTDQGRCYFCNAQRDTRSLCLLASARDAYAIEETRSFNGLYHIVEHLLSPIDGRHAHELRIDRIRTRIAENGIEEVIIAFDSTLEGDTTALYIKEQLANMPVRISRLAFGLPVGSPLDHIDGGTLLRALSGRQTL